MDTIRFTVLAFLTASCAIPPTAAPDLAGLAAAGIAPADLEVLTAAGQPLPEAIPDVLDVATTTAVALRQSPRLRAELALVRAAVAEAQQTRLWPNPLLSIAMRLPEAGGALEWDLGISAALGSWLTRSDRQDAANARVATAAAAALEIAFEEAETARIAFAAAEAAEHALRIRKRQSDVADELLVRQRESMRGGFVGSQAVLLAENQASSARIDLMAARVELRAAQLTLAKLLGTGDENANWTLQPDTSSPSSNDLEIWLASGRKRNPTVQRMAAMLRVAEAEARLAGAIVAQGVDAGVAAERDGEWSLGPAINVPLPIIDDGSARRARAEALVLSAQHSQSLALRDAEADLRATWESYHARRRTLEELRDSRLRILDAQLENKRALAAAGEAGPSEVLFSEQALLLVKVEEIQHRLRLQIDYSHLIRLAGGGPDHNGLIAP